MKKYIYFSGLKCVLKTDIRHKAQKRILKVRSIKSKCIWAFPTKLSRNKLYLRFLNIIWLYFQSAPLIRSGWSCYSLMLFFFANFPKCTLLIKYSILHLFYLNKDESKWKRNETRNRNNNLASLLSTTHGECGGGGGRKIIIIKIWVGIFIFYKCSTSKEAYTLVSNTHPSPLHFFTFNFISNPPSTEQYGGGGVRIVPGIKGEREKIINRRKNSGKKQNKIFVSLREHYFFPALSIKKEYAPRREKRESCLLFH